MHINKKTEYFSCLTEYILQIKIFSGKNDVCDDFVSLGVVRLLD